MLGALVERNKQLRRKQERGKCTLWPWNAD